MFNDSYNDNISCIFCDFVHQTPVTVSVVQGIVGLFLFGENVITAVALVKSQNLKVALKYFLINLTIIDALSSLVYSYHGIVVYIIIDDYIECYARYSLVCFFSTLSLSTVMTLTLERLLALYYPFQYISCVTKRNTLLYLIFTWILCLIIAFIGMSGSNSDIKVCNWLELASTTTNLTFGVATAVVSLLISAGNVVVFIMARKHIKAIVPVLTGELKTKTGLKMNFKATITTILIVVPVLITSVPFSIFSVYICYDQVYKNKTESIGVINGLYSLSMLNGFINPLIYSWRLSELRISFKRLFRQV